MNDKGLGLFPPLSLVFSQYNNLYQDGDTLGKIAVHLASITQAASAYSGPFHISKTDLKAMVQTASF